MSPVKKKESELSDEPASVQPENQPLDSTSGRGNEPDQSFKKISSYNREFECSTSLSLVQIVEKFNQEAETFELESSLGKVKGQVFGKGKPVYFLNGTGTSSQFYAPIAWLLRDHYKTVLFDTPLYFPDSCKKNEISIKTLSNVVKEIAELHSDSNISLYASSFGTMIGLNCLAHYSDQFSKGLFQGAYYRRQLSFVERSLSSLGRRMPGKMGSVPFYNRIQKINHRHWLPLLDQGRWEFYQSHSCRILVKTLAEQVRMIAHTNLKKELSSIQQPVLLIRTEGEGPILSECQEDLASKLSNVKSESIHSCGLIPCISRPHAIAKLIRNYV